MKIEKEVYPPIKKKHILMFRADKSLLAEMQTYLLHPNEWQFILQCAWIIGFKEGLEEGKKTVIDDDIKIIDAEVVSSHRVDTEDRGDMFEGEDAIKKESKEESE